jgi:hypothetical protein
VVHAVASLAQPEVLSDVMLATGAADEVMYL